MEDHDRTRVTHVGRWREMAEGLRWDVSTAVDELVESNDTNYCELLGKAKAGAYYSGREFRGFATVERRLKNIMEALGYDHVRVTVEFAGSAD